MITPTDQQKADAEAARLDETHPIPAGGQGHSPAVEKRCGNCKHYGMMKSGPWLFRLPVCFAAADIDGERFVDQTTPGGICELFNPMEQDPIPTRIDEGKRRAAAEPLIEPDTAPPFVRVDAEKPFLTGTYKNRAWRIWLDDGEFTADVRAEDLAWVPCASWDALVERLLPVYASDIARTRELHRITGLVIAKLDGGAE